MANPSLSSTLAPRIMVLLETPIIDATFNIFSSALNFATCRNIFTCDSDSLTPRWSAIQIIASIISKFLQHSNIDSAPV